MSRTLRLMVIQSCAVVFLLLLREMRTRIQAHAGTRITSASTLGCGVPSGVMVALKGRHRTSLQLECSHWWAPKIFASNNVVGANIRRRWLFVSTRICAMMEMMSQSRMNCVRPRCAARCRVAVPTAHLRFQARRNRKANRVSKSLNNYHVNIAWATRFLRSCLQRSRRTHGHVATNVSIVPSYLLPKPSRIRSDRPKLESYWQSHCNGARAPITDPPLCLFVPRFILASLRTSSIFLCKSEVLCSSLRIGRA
jgi:hypothetical protein